MEDVKEDPLLGNATSTPDTSPKARPKPRGKKRKRIERESGSESDEGLPENAFEVEKNVIASAVKNNLDDVSVKKILKKVVTNDHVLALVKLREEEESNREESTLVPKLTRAKVKELTKVSPKSAPWNLQNLELTPIKHIPVKTRPEVKALIAQELPEDEDDEEYQPTNDEVPSDDDQGLESCSDIDSQPRTPATPRSQQKISPKVVRDGPFKVPQEMSTPTRRRLQLEEEEATIALRTRSKLCLSETPIEHIESSFVPPDEPAVPAVDDRLWNDFLNECLNPASVSKHEDDDETDPEYNVAADPDAPDDDDEDALERSILKISKKELNDLVTELFNIMPEASVDDELANIGNGVLIEQVNNQTTARWEGKQEPPSEDEASVKMVDRIVFERRNSVAKASVGKMEPDEAFDDYDRPGGEADGDGLLERREETGDRATQPGVVDIQFEERPMAAAPAPPAPVRRVRAAPAQQRLHVLLDSRDLVLPEQLQILQQQLRQHIQLATSNFLQLFVHPIHWALGPSYKEYLEALVQIADKNPNSVVNVCNLKPAMELCQTWEKTVSEDTPENKKMVEFIQAQADRCQRRKANNCYYVGDFHETFLHTVANSPVFLYPSLLPAMPYGAVPSRRFSYLRSEDALIALGLEQFWAYVEANPALYPRPRAPARRWGLARAAQLVAAHALPALPHSVLMGHLTNVRRAADKDNPIVKFFASGKVEPVRHKLLPFNPALTLYEQPEHELPRIWLRYLAQTSKRFKRYLNRKRSTRTDFIGQAPAGVEVTTGLPAPLPPKAPLPIDFTKNIVAQRLNVNPPTIKPLQTDKFDLQIQKPIAEVSPSFYKLVQTSSGVNLVPIKLVQAVIQESHQNIVQTNTVDCNVTPISSTIEVRKDLLEVSHRDEVLNEPDHCKCCVLLRSICKKQTLITDYFRGDKVGSEPCRCRVSRSPRISNRLRLLVDRYKRRPECIYRDLTKKLKLNEDEKSAERVNDLDSDSDERNADDVEIASAFQIKLTLRSSIAQNIYIKKRINTLFSKFDPETDDPITLANQLEAAFKVEMVDLHKEFLGFLTADQAESIGKFRDYFVLNCIEGLARMVEEEVGDKSQRASILQQLSAFVSGEWAACAMCAALLARMRGRPRLARYTFRLFPHCRKMNPENISNPGRLVTPAQEDRVDEDHQDDTLTNGDATLTAPDYEADHSSSGEEDCETGSVMSAPSHAVHTVHTEEDIKTEPIMDTDDIHSIPCKTEPTDDSSDMSMMIMSEDEPIKIEPAEWKREEDKLILEHVLKVNLQSEERKDKTVMDILEEKQVLEVLSATLLNKSREALKDRVMYLLNVILAGGT